MRFRLELLQSFRLIDLERGQVVHLKQSARLLGQIALAQGPVSRDAMLAYLYPEVDGQISRNRLRVALSKLRSIFGPAIHETTKGISLDPQYVGCDAWELLSELAAVENAVTEEDQIDMALATLEKLGDGSALLSFGSASEGYLSRVSKLCDDALPLCLAAARHEDAFRMGALATRLNPSNPNHWRNFLLAAAPLNQTETVTKAMKAALPPEAIEAAEIKQALESAAAESAGPRPELLSREDRLKVALFDILIPNRQDLLQAVLTTPQSLALSGKFPKQMHDLLEHVDKDYDNPTSDWQRSMARLVGLKAWLNDADGVLELGYRMVEKCPDVAVQRALWNAISIGHFLLRQWPEATTTIQKTREFAEQTGNEVNICTAIGNAAFYKMHQGKFAEAMRDYEGMVDRLQALDTPHSRFEIAMGYGNYAFAPVLSGDWKLARQMVTKAIELKTQDSPPLEHGLLSAALGCVVARLGEVDAAPQLIRPAFLEAFATESDRTLQITFELAAGALVSPENACFRASVIDWVDRWRLRTRLPRSKAEEQFCSAICGTEALPKAPLDLESEPRLVGRELMKRLRAQASSLRNGNGNGNGNGDL
jgi:tetratricopeptide (TPR) repeat protein